MGKRYFLCKTEPTTFSIMDLERAPQQTTFWEGVRNYQARNILRDRMRKGDWVYIYHSNVTTPGIVGYAEVTSAAYPDATQFDTKSIYFDMKSKRENPRWWGVDMQWRGTFGVVCTRDRLRACEETANMPLLARGNRLSVHELSEAEYGAIWLMVSG
jgi:predicted RNA-binding protein with PUA-like domain